MIVQSQRMDACCRFYDDFYYLYPVGGNRVINIIIKECNDEEKIIYIKQGEKNIWGLFSLMQFEEGLEYYGISLKRKTVDGEKGYVFNKSIDEELVFEETKRFINEHDLENKEEF